MCYRGCILHLHHASSRVDLHVILMLERQFICFSPISLRPSALAIIFSCALGLRNPSAFSHAALHAHYVTCCFHHTGVFISWGVASVCCFSPMLYVAQNCHCHALGLLVGLLLSLAIKSKVIAHMYCLYTPRAVIGHIIISGL